MAIPLAYNLRSIRVRWTSTVVAVLGIAGTVGVFVAMLSLARGFKVTVASSGSADNAIIRRAGATAEVDGVLPLNQVRVIEVAPGIARSDRGPLVSAEVVVVSTFVLRSTGTDANVQVRGVSPKALQVRKNVRMVAGRFFRPALTELVVGKNAALTYSGLTLGNTVHFGGGEWKVVGIFDTGGSAFDSEVWCDADVLNQIYSRPRNIFQSVTVHLTSPAAFDRFKDSVINDPRLTVQVDREVDYYEKQSRMVTTLIVVLGSLIAVVMGVGAVFCALNTMYSAVAERSREIATMRALGFSALSVVTSFLIEAVLVALLGGVLGCLAVLPLNGLTTGTVNWQTFSHLAFAFRITPLLLGAGLAFSVLMGVFGGVPPAIRAARRPVAQALREL